MFRWKFFKKVCSRDYKTTRKEFERRTVYTLDNSGVDFLYWRILLYHGYDSVRREIKYLIAADTHPEHHYQKERLPAIKGTLKGKKFSIIDILGFEDDKRGRNLESITTAEGSNFFKKQDLERINNKFYERIMSYGFDILCLFTIDSLRLFILPETLDKIRRNGKYIVGFFGDDEFCFDIHKYWLPLFDVVVAYTKNEVDKYNKLSHNVLHLPLGAYFDENISIKKMIKKEKVYDVLFVGRPYGPREKNVEYLIDNGISIVVFGSKEWAKNKKIKSHYHGFLPNEKYDETISKAKILIGFMEWKGKPHINAKLFDAAKTNQFIITTYYPPFERDYGFREGKHLVMYKSIGDLINKIKYYIRRPQDRKRIANNLHRKVKKEYDYKLLYRKLFTQIENRYSRKKNRNVKFKNNITVVIPLKKNKSLKKTSNLFTIYVTKNKEWVNDKIYYYEQFKRNFDKIIKTNFVILGDCYVHYSDFLDEYVDFLNRNFSFEKVVFDSFSKNINVQKIKFIYDVNSMIWKKERFKKEILKKMFSKKIMIDFRGECTHIPIYFNKFEDNKLLLRLNSIYSFVRSLRNLFYKFRLQLL